eukprot:TRINITY_DN21400_c0_g2_i1.p1 TRINITY_DN21400_c0_g2~~TRINITY_DN21400_c0_g2_i1.p1  ORF type:complete len:215 (-),score=25.15 TRINITY_DN21400_c0_g2_i1:231-875(-)
MRSALKWNLELLLPDTKCLTDSLGCRLWRYANSPPWNICLLMFIFASGLVLLSLIICAFRRLSVELEQEHGKKRIPTESRKSRSKLSNDALVTRKQPSPSSGSQGLKLDTTTPTADVRDGKVTSKKCSPGSPATPTRVPISNNGDGSDGESDGGESMGSVISVGGHHRAPQQMLVGAGDELRASLLKRIYKSSSDSTSTSCETSPSVKSREPSL